MTAARELEESDALYAGAEGIGSLDQVKDRQISMSDRFVWYHNLSVWSTP